MDRQDASKKSQQGRNRGELLFSLSLHPEERESGKKRASELGLGCFSSRHFYDNPIQFVGRSAFQYLSKLHTL